MTNVFGMVIINLLPKKKKNWATELRKHFTAGVGVILRLNKIFVHLTLMLRDLLQISWPRFQSSDATILLCQPTGFYSFSPSQIRVHTHTFTQDSSWLNETVESHLIYIHDFWHHHKSPDDKVAVTSSSVGVCAYQSRQHLIKYKRCESVYVTGFLWVEQEKTSQTEERRRHSFIFDVFFSYTHT